MDHKQKEKMNQILDTDQNDDYKYDPNLSGTANLRA